MAIEVIERYLSSILTPALKGYGVSETFSEYTIDIVRMQMYSCLKHWTDISFRKTLLVIGSEEGPFYEPAGKNDVKCFVVVTIRNSPFETLQSKNYAETGLTSELSNDNIKSVTRAAITYFNKLDLTALSKQAQQSEQRDIYGELAAKYPVAWTALKHLAGTSGKKVEYTKVPFERPFVLDGVEFSDIDDSESIKIFLDGYSSEIDSSLTKALYNVLTYDTPLVVDCFKMLTRNIDKLLRILEYILTHDRAFATSNYYFENGYIERRTKPLKAAVCGKALEDMKNHFSQTAGLGYKHAAVLKSVYLSLLDDIKQ